MKVRIVKPLAGSGYFSGNEVETDQEGLEKLLRYNEVEVLESNPVATPDKLIRKPIKKTK